MVKVEKLGGDRESKDLYPGLVNSRASALSGSVKINCLFGERVLVGVCENP